VGIRPLSDPLERFCHDSGRSVWQYGTLGSHRGRGAHVNPARRIAASIATASSLIAAPLLVAWLDRANLARAIFGRAGARDRVPSDSLRKRGPLDVPVLCRHVSRPGRAAAARNLRSGDAAFGQLSLIAPNGSARQSRMNGRAVHPIVWYAEVAAPVAGTGGVATDQR